MLFPFIPNFLLHIAFVIFHPQEARHMVIHFGRKRDPQAVWNHWYLPLRFGKNSTWTQPSPGWGCGSGCRPRSARQCISSSPAFSLTPTHKHSFHSCGSHPCARGTQTLLSITWWKGSLTIVASSIPSPTSPAGYNIWKWSQGIMCRKHSGSFSLLQVKLG